jgi:hypothetical protein
MPNAPAPLHQRLSMIVQAPRVQHGVRLVRRTMLPPARHSRLKRMAAAAVFLAGLGFAAYVATGSLGWAILLLVVGVPVVVLPTILIIGMVLEARETQENG